MIDLFSLQIIHLYIKKFKINKANNNLSSIYTQKKKLNKSFKSAKF